MFLMFVTVSIAGFINSTLTLVFVLHAAKENVIRKMIFDIAGGFI